MQVFLRSCLIGAIALALAGCDFTHSSVVVEPAPGAANVPAGDTSTGSQSIPASPTAGRPLAPVHTQVPGGSYQVVAGDTLYSIAFRNKVDFRDLASWNGVAMPYTIHPGQRLRLAPPAGSAVVAAAPTPVPSAPPPPRPVPGPQVASTPTASPQTASGAPMFQPVPEASASKPDATVPPIGAPAGSATSTPPVAAAPVAHAGTLPSPANPASHPVATAPTGGVRALGSAQVPVSGSTTSVVPVAGVVTPKAPTVAPTPVVAAGASHSAGGVAWRWPAQGKLLKGFQAGDAIPGIELGGNPGDPITAAADGVVVYSGNGLVGYGELIIIKHNDAFLSAYGHNRKRLVKEGQRVTAGQQIAEMGSTGASHTELQFQIRRDGNPVDPTGYLPAR